MDKEGNVNVNDLAKSYVALEKKLGAPKEGIPANAEGYKINLKNPLLVVDKAINERLFQLGLTNEQVQGVYDIAAEILIPQIQAFEAKSCASLERRSKSNKRGFADRLSMQTLHTHKWSRWQDRFHHSNRRRCGLSQVVPDGKDHRHPAKPGMSAASQYLPLHHRSPCDHHRTQLQGGSCPLQ